MSSSPLKFLLLACIVYWTSGMAGFLHEYGEHAGHDDVAAATASAGERPPDKHKNNHDECPTCRLLATMSADRAAPPAALLCIAPPALPAEAVGDRLPPVVDPDFISPIRGPPDSPRCA